MPTYRYECPICGKQHTWKSRWQPVCDVCGVKMNRVYKAAGFILKGGGYYSAENRK